SLISNNQERLPTVSRSVLNAAGQGRLDWPHVSFRTPLDQDLQNRLCLLGVVTMSKRLDRLVRCSALHLNEDRARCERVRQIAEASNSDGGEGVEFLCLDLLPVRGAAVNLGASAVSAVQHAPKIAVGLLHLRVAEYAK